MGVLFLMGFVSYSKSDKQLLNLDNKIELHCKDVTTTYIRHEMCKNTWVRY